MSGNLHSKLRRNPADSFGLLSLNLNQLCLHRLFMRLDRTSFRRMDMLNAIKADIHPLPFNDIST